MFKEKKKIIIESLGEFEWKDGLWYGYKTYLDNKIHIYINGKENCPDKNSVLNLTKQFNVLASKIKLAEEYIRTNSKITDYKEKNGELTCSELFLESELGSFNLLFSSLRNNEEYIQVHFKSGKPFEILTGDDEFDEDFELENNSSRIYSRSYLVTLGLFFVGVSVYVWKERVADLFVLPLFVFALSGLVSIVLGLFASEQKVEKWTAGTSSHEMSFILMVLAYPVYLILSLIYKK